jgi:predicted GH43/DUF377 family glycosyl hydrolase
MLRRMAGALFTELDVARLRTPFKFGEYVLTGSTDPQAFDSQYITSPFVFSSGDTFYMTYLGFDGIGYQTGIAQSADLIRWEKRGVIGPRIADSRYLAYNNAITWILRDNELGSSSALKKVGGRYLSTWHAYPHAGFEGGAAVIGLAWSDDLFTWEWGDPVIEPGDGAAWERGGLYKSCLVESDGTYYLFYNAKDRTEADGTDLWHEQIGVATSSDLRTWVRDPGNPVVANGGPESYDECFASDPNVLRCGDVWAMVYFGLSSDHHARQLAAFSSDLVSFDKVDELLLECGSPGSLDDRYAHKAALISWRGDLYHFYEARSDYPLASEQAAFPAGRQGIAVARSRPW